MGWLAPYADDLLRMAGYPSPHPLAGDALTYAEQAIEGYTRRVWGSSQPFIQRVYLSAKSYVLPLPPDVTSVATINGEPAPAGITWTLTALGLEATDAEGRLVAWAPGVWTVAGQRGSAAIPQGVLKAASLLINAYLGLSDAQRSQMATASRGDLSYSMRYAQLSVPEAETYLAPYVNRIAGGLA
ncbi:hypothetical protein [Meiothermus sp. Pnk-1]|uniref:hypothetical protein n=1 Tax=Meiothermus sp. Pnk-1 TaxID=873128 RepID=UPI000D7BDCBC|nr:hypothetical protein [Meiothermus sp. Pnk-1]PZA08638.1 hypothetical protein DNA98_00885 [Meiothermus sp. Pnk-1]